LLDAMRALKSRDGYSLTMIGTMPDGDCKPLVEATQIHRHITSLPHDEIMAEMRRHHVLVLPSLFEGFGLVLTEAMANGLPIIATSHTAAPDIIQDGVEGYVIPIRSADAIEEKLVELREDEKARQAMGAAAILRARQMAWEEYRRAMGEQLRTRIKAS
jgi:starch synthase